MSRISLCLLIKPPHLQDIASSTENALPQIHVVDIPSGFHPYHNDIASQKALLCRQYPNSSMGSTVSHVEALFSLAKFIASWICLWVTPYSEYQPELVLLSSSSSTF